MFCPECGIDHHIADREEVAAADRQIALAKIEADRDIKIAQISAGAAKELAETDNALQTARAKGQAEGMETVLGELGGGGGDQVPDAEPEPIEIPEPEPAPDPPADLEPPIVETSRPSSSGSSSGWWAGYPRG